MIEAIELTKKYGDIIALKGLSFKIEQGDIVGLLGQNGAGKTTTLRILTTYLAPSSGTAKVAGFDIHKDAMQVRKSIGYLPETVPLYPQMKVLEYLLFVANLKNVDSSLIKSHIEEVLTLCGIETVRNRLCAHLSKGFRQRTGIAAALVHKPPVLILDEPTSGLDPAQIIEMRTLIHDLAKHHTIILSTHVLSEVAQVCSKVIIISNGKLVQEGTVKELTKEQTLEQKFLEAVAA